MQNINVIIGEFRSLGFAEGLQARLSEHPSLDVTVAKGQPLAEAINAKSGATVMVVDAAIPEPDLDVLVAAHILAVIQIGSEGRSVRLLRHQIDARMIEDLVMILAGRLNSWMRAVCPYPALGFKNVGLAA